MCLFIGGLDGMEPWAIDIGNTYLEALVSEKVCIRAEPEFLFLLNYKVAECMKRSS